jgi:molecular chaperone GrpE
VSDEEKRPDADERPQEGGGWEALAEESPRVLAPSPELEEALRVAAAAVEEPDQSAPPPGEAAAAAVSPREAELRLELEAARDRLLRLYADFENFRRRAARERLEAEQYGHQNLVKDLLVAVDNLDRAIHHARSNEGEDLEGLLRGVELVRRELWSALARHGVTEIEATGQPFDPARHEAMAQTVDDSVAANTVVEVLQKGYLLRDRLLRAARVVVSRRAEDGGGGEAAG